MMYFVARVRNNGNFSNPTSSKTGHSEIDFVEQLFIEYGFNKNKDIRNKKRPEKQTSWLSRDSTTTRTVEKNQLNSCAIF